MKHSDKKIPKIQLFLHVTTLLIACIIVTDFILPGKVYTSEVIDIKKQRQNYYNAGGNYHYSYRVVTNKHSFSVSKDFEKSIKNKKIKYSVSLLFKKINKYGLHDSKDTSIYSLRIVSGLVLPLIVISTILISFTLKKRISTLLFILRIILLANLILLLN